MVVASTSTERQQHGAVAAIGPRALAVAVNSSRSHPANCTDPKREAAFHAEVALLRQLRGDLKSVTVYVARVMKDGSAGLSKPCPNCEAALNAAGVKEVLWTTN